MLKRMVILCMLAPILAYAAVEPLDKVVAVVNDDVITSKELNAEVSLLTQQLTAKKMQIPTDSVLRKQVLQHLIDVNLQMQLAKSNGITVDDAELNEIVSKIANDNKLSLAELREALSKQGLNWETYRNNLRKEVVISRVQQKAVGKDVMISAKQIEEYLHSPTYKDQSKQTFHLQNIVIPLPEAPTPEQINKARAKAQALLLKIKQGSDFSNIAIAESSGEYALEGGDLGERHIAELPEIFAKHVVNMKAGEVVGPLRTGNGLQLLKLVATHNADEHHQVLKTHVRHILLKQDANMTALEARRQVNNLYQQLKSGKDFALMAKQYSLDAASAVKGGDLGWVTADELVPAFAEAMNALPLRVVSKPVKSPFGWHLIEVLERKTEDDSLAFQRQQVQQFLHQRKFAEAVQNWVQHVRAESYVDIVDKQLA